MQVRLFHLLVGPVGQVGAVGVGDGQRFGLVLTASASGGTSDTRAVARLEFAVEADSLMGERVEALGRGDRQRPQEQRIDEAESRRAGADRQSQRQDGRRGGHLALLDLPPAEDSVGAKRIEPWEQADIAALFALPQRGAEGPASFRGFAAMLDGFLDVRLELFVYFAVQASPRITFVMRDQNDILPPYSERSAATGSMRTARITGGSAASNAAVRIVTTGSASMARSVVFTW